MVNEIGAASNQRLENQLTELTSLVRQLAYGICTSVEYPTDLCPTLQETESDQPENVGAIGGYQMPPQGNSPSLEDLMKQLATSNQKYAVPVEYDRHHPRPQNANRTVSQHYEPITVGQVQQPSFPNNSKSERECKCNHLSRPTEADSKPNADSQSRPKKTVPLSFPTRTMSTRKPESDEELLKLFREVEINIPFLDAIN
ncbi:hypothetical protein CR513_36640, partial [Mucuna pruriens]